MSHNKIKKQYDRRVLATFDIIGCHFIDTVYNDLFLKAKHQFSIGNAKSLTDVYRSYVIWYMQSVSEKPKNYIEIMKKFLEYYNTQTNTVTATLSDLENKILSQFIPPEYYQDFNNANKEKTLYSIIIKAINQLGEIVLEADMLGRIIDDHLNPINVQILQEKMTDVFISQREEYYSKFVNEISKNNGNTTVSREQFKKLKSAYAEEVKKRIAAEADRDKALQLLQASLKRISELEANTPANTYPREDILGRAPSTPQRVYASAPSHNTSNNVTHNISNNVPARKTDTPLRNLQSAKSPQAGVGLKLSDLNINDRTTNDRTTNDRTMNEPNGPERTDLERSDLERTEVVEKSDLMRSEVAEKTAETSEERDSTEDSDESGDDSEEVHKKQKAALIGRNAEFSLGLDDDPGFGN